jgi:hypothetical protein
MIAPDENGRKGFVRGKSANHRPVLNGGSGPADLGHPRQLPNTAPTGFEPRLLTASLIES